MIEQGVFHFGEVPSPPGPIWSVCVGTIQDAEGYVQATVLVSHEGQELGGYQIMVRGVTKALHQEWAIEGIGGPFPITIMPWWMRQCFPPCLWEHEGLPDGQEK